MKNIKKIIARSIVAVELCVIAAVCVFGPHGIRNLRLLSAENNELELRVSALREDVQKLEHTIVAWNQHPFYKEQVAREQLQMARKDEIIYYV